MYGGGGNNGATLTNDFVELQNLAASAVGLTGYSVQYISATPGADHDLAVTPLTGSVPASGHFLVQEAAGATGRRRRTADAGRDRHDQHVRHRTAPSRWSTRHAR